MLLWLGGCDVGFHLAPGGATLIPVTGEYLSRYLLLEKEQIPTGHLNAIVLQQFPGGSPGVRLAFQIDCADGPSWSNNTEAGTLSELRQLPVGNEFLRTKDKADPDQQIATWLCR
jgi:hypothetical protein